jgi:hypothetical protein
MALLIFVNICNMLSFTSVTSISDKSMDIKAGTCPKLQERRVGNICMNCFQFSGCWKTGRVGIQTHGQFKFVLCLSRSSSPQGELMKDIPFLRKVTFLIENVSYSRMKNAVFWGVTSRGSCKNRRIGGK